MEPPTKRLRLQQNPFDDDDEDADELTLTPSQFDAQQDPGYQLDKGRAKAAFRLKSTFEAIFEKYGKDFEGIGDEIDLHTGEVVVDNGHLESMVDEDDKEVIEEARPGAHTFQHGWNDRTSLLHGPRSSGLASLRPTLGTAEPLPLGPPLVNDSPADPAWHAPELPGAASHDTCSAEAEDPSPEYGSKPSHVFGKLIDLDDGQPPKLPLVKNAHYAAPQPMDGLHDANEESEDGISLAHLLAEDSTAGSDLSDEAISEDAPDLAVSDAQSFSGETSMQRWGTATLQLKQRTYFGERRSPDSDEYRPRNQTAIRKSEISRNFNQRRSSRARKKTEYLGMETELQSFWDNYDKVSHVSDSEKSEGPSGQRSIPRARDTVPSEIEKAAIGQTRRRAEQPPASNISEAETELPEPEGLAPETFTRNMIDSSYEFSDEEDDWQIGKRTGFKVSETSDKHDSITASVETIQPVSLTNGAEEPPNSEILELHIAEPPPGTNQRQKHSPKLTERQFGNGKQGEAEQTSSAPDARQTKAALVIRPAQKSSVDPAKREANTRSNGPTLKPRSPPQLVNPKATADKLITPTKPARGQADKNANPNHLTRSAKKTALASLIPDDPEDNDELSVLFKTPPHLGLSRASSASPGSHPSALANPTPKRTSRKYSLLVTGNTNASTPRETLNPVRAIATTASRKTRRASTEAHEQRRSVAHGSPLAGTPVEPVSVTPNGKGPLSLAEDVFQTPGGTLRRCGEDGFECDRDFCFICCK